MLRDFIQKHIAMWDVVVVADYNKGVLDREMIAWLLHEARAHSVPVIVDAKPQTLLHYVGVTLVTPNLKEAQETTGVMDSSTAALLLQKKLKSSVLITMGDKGMLLRSGKNERMYPPLAKGVVDVSGAGDTVVAATAVALAHGQTLQTAVERANIAASIVVQKPGTAIVTQEELEENFKKGQDVYTHTKTQSILLLERVLKTHKDAGDKIVFTNGVFDLLHEGHISVLETARSHGDVLVVGVNSDASVRRLKGPGRPTLPLATRMRMLAALSAVTYVVPFDEDTPLRLIKRLLPDVLVKGGDYTESTIVGASVVKARGGRVVVVPTVNGKSTTRLLKKIRKNKN